MRVFKHRKQGETRDERRKTRGKARDGEEKRERERKGCSVFVGESQTLVPLFL